MTLDCVFMFYFGLETDASHTVFDTIINISTPVIKYHVEMNGNTIIKIFYNE